MIILDTNVISEFARKVPSPSVLQWLARYESRDVYLTSISIMELYFGAWSLPIGQKRTELERKIELQTTEYFDNRILPFDLESSRICAGLIVNGKARTPFAKLPDYQIASIAKAHGYAVATRDVDDFRHDGLEIINPWTD